MFASWATHHWHWQVIPADQIPPTVLLWTIVTNQPEAVRCVVADCGFQFRWLSETDFKQLFDLLLHIEGGGQATEFGVWRAPDYDPQEYWGDRCVLSCPLPDLPTPPVLC